MKRSAFVGIAGLALLTIFLAGVVGQAGDPQGIAQRVAILEAAVAQLQADVVALQTESATQAALIQTLTSDLAAAQVLIGDLQTGLADETDARIAADDALEAAITANAVPQNLLDFAGYLMVDGDGNIGIVTPLNFSVQALEISNDADGNILNHANMRISNDAINIDNHAGMRISNDAMIIDNHADMEIENEAMNISDTATMMLRMEGMMIKSTANTLNTVEGLLVKIN